MILSDKRSKEITIKEAVGKYFDCVLCFNDLGAGFMLNGIPIANQNVTAPSTPTNSTTNQTNNVPPANNTKPANGTQVEVQKNN
jgi:hypothetical protein